MRNGNLIAQVEDYVRKVFLENKVPSAIAHDFSHVHRVRNWALFIARSEDYPDLETVEMTALLHDIGRALVTREGEHRNHGEVGSETAGEYLREKSSLPEETIDYITRAIRYHNARPSLVDDVCSVIGSEAKLIQILRDADTMDAIGAVGLTRALTSRHSLPEYDPNIIRGETWGLSSDGFTTRFDAGKGIGEYIVDQVNFQICLYENLRTETARKLAGPLVQYMRDFILQLEQEVTDPTV